MSQNQVLSSRIKIVTECDRLGFLESNASFYSKYSSFTLKALGRKSFQNFLGRMLTIEHIDETTVNTIDINVYPAPRKNGNNIAGNYSGGYLAGAYSAGFVYDGAGWSTVRANRGIWG